MHSHRHLHSPHLRRESHTQTRKQQARRRRTAGVCSTWHHLRVWRQTVRKRQAMVIRGAALRNSATDRVDLDPIGTGADDLDLPRRFLLSLRPRAVHRTRGADYPRPRLGFVNDVGFRAKTDQGSKHTHASASSSHWQAHRECKLSSTHRKEVAPDIRSRPKPRVPSRAAARRHRRSG